MKINKNFKKDFKYTWEHKKCFLQMEKQLTGKITLKGIMHDVDKLFLYLVFTKKEVSKLHRKYAKHHTNNHKTKDDIVQAIIDWESARLSKPDKQESAKEYLLSYIPEHTNTYKEVMKELGVW